MKAELTYIKGPWVISFMPLVWGVAFVGGYMNGQWGLNVQLGPFYVEYSK